MTFLQEKIMKKQLEFLKSKKELFFFTFSSLIIFYTVFQLGNLDEQYYLIALETIILLLGLYLIFSFFFYKKSELIRETNERLIEEIERLKAESISEKKELEEYFLLWVHQIKTPITASKLIIQKELTKEREAKLEIQLQYIESYTDMAMNYLKLMRTNTDMDISEVNLGTLVGSVLKKYSHLFFAKGIKLELGKLDISVVSDTKWLSILFEQILSNSLKYTEKGFIKIYFKEEERELIVEDSGIGIRSEDIPKIFDKGYSGFNGRLNQKSSGLGLFLGKKIANRLGIKILVESEIGKGSKFSLKFPERGINLTEL